MTEKQTKESNPRTIIRWEMDIWEKIETAMSQGSREKIIQI